MKKKTFCFDLDGVICFTKGNKYIQSKPNKKAIKFINELHESGNFIIILQQDLWVEIMIINLKLKNKAINLLSIN